MIVQRVRPPLLETPFEVFDQGVFTPNDRFFVRWHWGDIPTSIDATAFRLNVRGHVGKRLSPNMAGDLSPLHGQGWTSEWTVESESASQAVLVFNHEPGEWPWSYHARQQFHLADDALHLRLTCRNTSPEAMPCGLGFHPYFPCGPDTRIETEVEQVWTVDENVLPVARMPAEGRYAIGDDPVCGRGLDNGYSGWSGRALLTDPGWPFEIELSSPEARFFQLYSPEQGGIFVAEPVTHANAALNEPEEDWARLGSNTPFAGRSFSGRSSAIAVSAIYNGRRQRRVAASEAIDGC
jgi:aldose 1-epimerase